MDAMTAFEETDQLVRALIAELTPDDREKPTPCADWNVHDLIAHMCSGGHMVAGGLEGAAPPDPAPDFLADGPAAGWDATAAHVRAVATPERLQALHQMPFGEVSGEMAMSVIVADHATHAWDLAIATGQSARPSDELAEFSLDVWAHLAPPEGREPGSAFAAAIDVPAGASAVDRLAGYTGRQP